MGEELQKALMTASGHTNLYQEDLSPLIYNILLEELPLFQLIGTEQAQGPVHQYRVRASLPEAWVEGELSDPNFQSATHTVRNAYLKIVRTWGGVSGFMQKMTERWVNALQESVETSVEGLANTVEWITLYGNYAADSYMPNGIYGELLADTTAKLDYASGGNIYDVNAAFTLTHLDNMIDRAKGYRGGQRDRHVLLASRNMISRISGLQTRISRDVPMIEFEGGFRMAAYRDVGILPTDIAAPQAVTTSPAVTATPAAGGSLADDEWFYAIASITLQGEQLPGTVDSGITATTNNSNDLTWTADANAKLYAIYRGTTATVADMELLTIIAAKSYDANGNLSTNVAAWSDEGTLTTVPSVHPQTAGEEYVFLVNVDRGERGLKMLGAVSPLGDPIDNFFTYTPLATVNSAFRYMIEGFMAPKIPYPTTNVIARRAQLS